MHSIKLGTTAVRRGLVLLSVSLMLAACGGAGGKGNLDAGAKYQAGGEYRAAYIEGKKVLQRDHKNGEAWLLVGQASMMLGNLNDAISDLHNAAENGVPKARWVVPMGRALLMTGQNDKLLATLPADNTFDPQVKVHVAVLRGDAYRELKQFENARQSYSAALAVEPKDALALVGLARLAAIGNDPEAARKYVQQALAASPASPQAWVAQGDLAVANQDLASAEADYQKALDVKHADWLPQERFYALSRLANAQAQQNRLDEALVNIATLEKMSPQQPYPHYLHAVVLYKQGHLDDAVSQLQQVLKASPDNGQAQLLMGAVNYAKGNYGQTEMFLSNVLGIDPKNVEARKLLALTFFREGRSRQALDTIRPIAPGTPSDADLLALLQRAVAEDVDKPAMQTATAGTGNPVHANPATGPFATVDQALASGNDAEAIRLLKAVPAGSATTEARRNTLLVMTYARDKRVDEAVKVAAAYAAKYPNDSAAQVLYGTALIAAGKRADAHAQYSKAVKLDPRNTVALLNLANLDALEGHYQASAGGYEAVLKQDPKNAAAMTSLARLAVLQRDNAEAIKWFKRAIVAAPKSTDAYIGLVALYGQNGQFDAALDTARQLAQANPDDPLALHALGAAELNAGHHAEALKPLQRAVDLAPQVPLYRTDLARVQILNKDTQAAKTNLDAVIKADPGQVTAVALRAFMESQAHNLPGALALARTLQAQPATKVAGLTLEGDLYMANKSWAKASQAYQQALKVQYDRALVVKTFQALSASGGKQPEGVLTDWLGKHPDDAAVRLLLGQYYLGHAQDTQAAAEYERVLKAYPSNIDALNNLAWIYTGQRNPKALALAERAHKLAPDSPAIADTYGWALIAGNQPKTALPILEQAAKAAPAMPSIQYHLAVAQARTGNRTAARATLEALHKSGANFEDKAAAEKLYRELGATTGSGG
jgi:putative PEP-CTERM system TPR-repeat lipoprotein